jgi:hypothetical protein
MKNIIVGLFCINLFAITATSQNMTDTVSAQNKGSDLLIVDASCGQCNFNLSGKGCDLAVRISGLAYFVDGTRIDDHGDAHSSEGFCKAIRKAHVKGNIVDNRFQLQYFKLIPLAEEE